MPNRTKLQQPGSNLSGACPYCLGALEICFDIKGRPYWRCWRCEVRSFGTNTTLTTLQEKGWIWSGKQPVKRLRELAKQMLNLAGSPDETSQ